MSEAKECDKEVETKCRLFSVSIVPFFVMMAVFACQAIYLQFVFCEVCCCPQEAGHFKNRRIAHYCLLALCLLVSVAVIVVECIEARDSVPDGDVEEESYARGLYLEIGSLLLIVPRVVCNIIMQVILRRAVYIDPQSVLLLSQTETKGAVILSTLETHQNSEQTRQTLVVVV